MRKRARLCTVEAEEADAVRRLAGSHKKSILLVQLARIVASLLENPSLSASEAVPKACSERKHLCSATLV